LAARLPKLEVMSIGRTPAADETGLRAQLLMGFIAFADRLYERDSVFIILHCS
jgi:hypothetical protein